MPEPGKPYKKVKYKAEKIKRQKKIRDAKRDLKARKYHEEFGTPYVDESNMTEEEKKARRAAEKEERKAARREAREAKLAGLSEEERAKALKKPSRIEKRKQKKEAKRKLQDDINKMRKEEKAKARVRAEELLFGTNEAATTKTSIVTSDTKAPVELSGLLETKTLIETSEIKISAKSREINGEHSKVSETNGKHLVREVKVQESKGATPKEEVTIIASKEGSTAEDTFATGKDEIKLGINIDGKVRVVPGYGRVDRYPTKAEKRNRKLEAQASEAGMSVEEYKAKLDAEREAKEAPERERLAKQREARGGLKAPQWHKFCRLAEEEGQEVADNYFADTVKRNAEKRAKKEMAGGNTQTDSSADNSSVNGQSKEASRTSGDDQPAEPISEKKMKKYTEKAVEKGISVEEYIQKRHAKKAKGNSEAEDSGTSFVVDSVGDDALEEPSFILDAEGDEDILSRPQPQLIWHPDMLGDRQVKELSKVERKARLEWMRERRRERNIALGKNPLSLKERKKLKVQRKMKHRNQMVAGILNATGKPKEETTKEEIKAARRAAGREMRHQKREKRNKMIHRKEVGENLAGVYGPPTQPSQ
jgi:hypothetical protein